MGGGAILIVFCPGATSSGLRRWSGKRGISLKGASGKSLSAEARVAGIAQQATVTKDKNQNGLSFLHRMGLINLWSIMTFEHRYQPHFIMEVLVVRCFRTSSWIHFRSLTKLRARPTQMAMLLAC